MLVEIFVHRQILCARSEFFRVMLDGESGMVEAQQGYMEIKDFDADVVQLLQFIYTGNLFV
jgi:hypothetical protein